MSNSKNKLTLLAVLAHPDDESFGMGGTLAFYAERGVDVHLVCATRGEVGEVGPEYLQEYTSIADLRESELRCAAGHLGLKEVYFLGYRDSGMVGSPDNEHPESLYAAPVDEVAAKVARYIRELKPQVVLTFDPIGGYRHPDHIHIHEATKLAFDLAGDSAFKSDLPPHKSEKLFYHTIPKGFIRFAVRLLKLLRKDPSKWGRNEDIDLTQLSVDFPMHAKINYSSVAKRKEAASYCHASQIGPTITGGAFRWLFRLFGFGSKDIFMQAYPPPTGSKVQTDLFEGI
ncbi:MAG: PIG-L family deacetylase [Anaerolineales bacterium]|nr:PIG-L family deacetylase [Chloroflexota bacterium]MBL6980808.1 PIG-L family deacetylase [Anaerolineales bacterium]